MYVWRVLPNDGLSFMPFMRYLVGVCLILILILWVFSYPFARFDLISYFGTGDYPDVFLYYVCR